jgi:hypothetical protein
MAPHCAGPARRPRSELGVGSAGVALSGVRRRGDRVSLGYDDWRHATELVSETDSLTVGRMHVRMTETTWLCGEDHPVIFGVLLGTGLMPAMTGAAAGGIATTPPSAGGTRSGTERSQPKPLHSACTPSGRWRPCGRRSKLGR